MLALPFKTYTSASKSPRKTTPGECFRCHDCGRSDLCFLPGEYGGNYSSDRRGHLRCIPCSDARQREQLRTPEPFVAYVSSDGLYVTTWTGGKLGMIVNSWTVNLTRWSYLYGKTMLHCRVIDIHGNRWHGRGDKGMCIRLRRCVGKDWLKQ